MIKHIVILNLKEENKIKNSKIIKKKLEALKNTIPEILMISVNFSIKNVYTNSDLILECEFKNMDDLEKYQSNFEHLEVVNFIKNVVTQRFCIEYEF